MSSSQILSSQFWNSFPVPSSNFRRTCPVGDNAMILFSMLQPVVMIVGGTWWPVVSYRFWSGYELPVDLLSGFSFLLVCIHVVYLCLWNKPILMKLVVFFIMNCSNCISQKNNLNLISSLLGIFIVSLNLFVFLVIISIHSINFTS